MSLEPNGHINFHCRSTCFHCLLVPNTAFPECECREFISGFFSAAENCLESVLEKFSQVFSAGPPQPLLASKAHRCDAHTHTHTCRAPDKRAADVLLCGPPIRRPLTETTKAAAPQGKAGSLARKQCLSSLKRGDKVNGSRFVEPRKRCVEGGAGVNLRCGRCRCDKLRRAGDDLATPRAPLPSSPLCSSPLSSSLYHG